MYRSRRYFLSFPISLKQNEEVSTINFSLKGIFCSIFAISKPTLQTNTHNFFPYLLFFIVIHLIYHIIHQPYFKFFYFIWHLNLIFFILFYNFISYISTCNKLHASSIFLLLILYYSFQHTLFQYISLLKFKSIVFHFLLPKLISILALS